MAKTVLAVNGTLRVLELVPRPPLQSQTGEYQRANYEADALAKKQEVDDAAAAEKAVIDARVAAKKASIDSDVEAMREYIASHPE